MAKAKTKVEPKPAEATLEAMIRAAAKNGELTHLSVVPIAGKGPDGVVWSASYSPASKWGSGFGRHADPVEAIKLAMTDQRFKGLVTKLRSTLETGVEFSEGNLKVQARKALKKLPPVDDSDFN